MAFRWGADAICEKPLVLNPWNLDGISEMEETTGRKVNAILQLRLHPSIVKLKRKIDSIGDKIHEVDVSYITSRGRWYDTSWKGDEAKSGGIGTNIGIHFFDMLGYLFGKNLRNTVHIRNLRTASGYLEFEKARVRWFLSIDSKHLNGFVPGKKVTYRSIRIDGTEVEFSDGFSDLHTTSYKKIMLNEGFSIDEARSSIEIVSAFRQNQILIKKDELHPLAKEIVRYASS